MKTEVVSYIDNGSPAAERGSGQTRLNCKFVLIAHSECLHFVVGPVTKYRYHANLVDQFCNEHSIASAWLQKPDVLEILEGGARILGGGYLQIDEARRRMKLYGVSRAYGVFNARELAELTRKAPFFHGYRTSFG